MTDDVDCEVDIEYGPNKFDLHIPQAAAARPPDARFPLVVFVHGGAWRS